MFPNAAVLLVIHVVNDLYDRHFQLLHPQAELESEGLGAYSTSQRARSASQSPVSHTFVVCSRLPLDRASLQFYLWLRHRRVEHDAAPAMIVNPPTVIEHGRVDRDQALHRALLYLIVLQDEAGTEPEIGEGLSLKDSPNPASSLHDSPKNTKATSADSVPEAATKSAPTITQHSKESLAESLDMAAAHAAADDASPSAPCAASVTDSGKAGEASPASRPAASPVQLLPAAETGGTRHADSTGAAAATEALVNATGPVGTDIRADQPATASEKKAVPKPAQQTGKFKKSMWNRASKKPSTSTNKKK